MTILVTNDDGYIPNNGFTYGLKILLDAAKSLDKNSYAIVPGKHESAVSKALTLHKPLRINKKEKNIYEINGKPADCVTFSLFCKEFKKPNLILSGINWGDNAGLHTIYSSGTLAACMEAAIFKVPSIGFSIHRDRKKWVDKEKHWKNELLLKNKIIQIIKKLKTVFVRNTFFSVNFPDDFKNAPIVIKEPQRQRFSVKLIKRKDPHGRPYYWITGLDEKKEKGKDFDSICSGKTVITPVTLDPVKNENIELLKGLFRGKKKL